MARVVIAQRGGAPTGSGSARPTGTPYPTCWDHRRRSAPSTEVRWSRFSDSRIRCSIETLYYRQALARVHHEGFGGYGDACAPGILAGLRPVRERGGVVLELGCGSGALTRHLVAAGHRVIATDASPAMLALNAPDMVRLLADAGVEARIARGFDDGQRLEEGLVAITGVRRRPEGSRE